MKKKTKNKIATALGIILLVVVMILAMSGLITLTCKETGQRSIVFGGNTVMCP